MTLQDLSAELARMYHDAPDGEMKVMICLFGIRYADQINLLIQRNGASWTAVIEQIVQGSGIPPCYGIEVKTMVKLARYVVPRN